jgi:hypothetical protein
VAYQRSKRGEPAALIGCGLPLGFGDAIPEPGKEKEFYRTSETSANHASQASLQTSPLTPAREGQYE